MDERNDAKDALVGCGVGWLIGGLILIALTMCGCRTRYVTTEVPVEVTRVEVQRDTVRRVDSVVWRDSVWHYVHGDSVVIERWHTRWRSVHDTVRVSRVDSVPRVVTVTRMETREVNRLRWWQRALMWLGGIALAGVSVGAWMKLRG